MSTTTATKPATTTATLAKTTSRKETIQKFAFAGMSCMSAAMVTNPLDVIKVRLQLQGNAAPGTAVKYRGFFTGLITMLREEGIRSWYRGLSASLVREGTYSTLRVGLYEPFKDLYHSDSSKPLPLYKKILAAMSSGAVAASITNPADLVKVRMQALSTDGKPRYTSLIQAWKTIYGQEGVGGLYRGVTANCQRAMLSTASQLASYDHIKHLILDSGLLEEGLLCQFTTAVGAGFIFACVTSPVDTIKSRYMSQQFSSSGKGLQYSSILDCVKKVTAKEGSLALYKGFFPNWARIGPHTIVTFLVLEQLRKMAGINPI